MGRFVVLGCAAGSVVVLTGETLQEIVSLRHTKHEVHRWAAWWGEGSGAQQCQKWFDCLHVAYVSCRSLFADAQESGTRGTHAGRVGDWAQHRDSMSPKHVSKSNGPAPPSL